MATIHSIPAPSSVEWSLKGSSDETFTLIDSNAAEYKGTTNSLPHPVLVVKNTNQLENNSFRIEVRNFVGSSVEIFSGKNYSMFVWISRLLRLSDPQTLICNVFHYKMFYPSNFINEIKKKKCLNSIHLTRVVKLIYYKHFKMCLSINKYVLPYKRLLPSRF